MSRSILLLSLLSLCAVLAVSSCNKTPTVAGPKALPASTLLEKVPAEAMGVVVVEAPYSLWHTLTTQLPLPMNKEAIAALDTELGAYWQKHLSFDPLRATTAVGFAIAEPLSGAVLIGPVPGTLQTETVVMESLDIVMMQHGDVLVVGMKPAVDMAMATLRGTGATLKATNKAFYAKILQHKAPISAAVAAAGIAPLVPIPPQLAGVDYGFVGASTESFSLAISGDPSKLQDVKDLLDGGLALARMQLPSALEELYPDNDGFENRVMQIFFKTMAKNVLNQIDLKIVGDTLIAAISVKLRNDSPPRSDAKIIASTLKYAPANTIGAVALQSDAALWDWAIAKSWIPAKEIQSMRKEIFAVVKEALGVQVAALHGGTVFVAKNAQSDFHWLSVTPGLRGLTEFRVVEPHSSDSQEDIVAITRGDTLFVGTRFVVEDALLARNSLQQSNPEFYQRIVALQDQAFLKIGDIRTLAPAAPLPALTKVQFAVIEYGQGRLRVSVEGQPEALVQLQTLFQTSMAEAQDHIAELKGEVLNDEGPWIAGAGLIVGEHLFRGMLGHLQPVVQGNILSLELSDEALNLHVGGLTVASYALGIGAYFFLSTVEEGDLRGALLGQEMTPVSGPIAIQSNNSLNAEVIRSTIREELLEVETCYEDTLVQVPTLAGTVVCNFTISPTGKVEKVTVAGVDNSQLQQCIGNVLKSMAFPKPAGGGFINIRYPFTLSPVVSEPK